GAAGHGPAHVPVTAVEEEVAVAPEAEDGRPIGRHGPKARAILTPIVVDGLREDVAGEAKDVVEVARRPAPVVARELRRRGETQPVAEARPRHQPPLVDAGNGRGEAAGPKRKG